MKRRMQKSGLLERKGTPAQRRKEEEGEEAGYSKAGPSWEQGILEQHWSVYCQLYCCVKGYFSEANC